MPLTIVGNRNSQVKVVKRVGAFKVLGARSLIIDEARERLAREPLDRCCRMFHVKPGCCRALAAVAVAITKSRLAPRVSRYQIRGTREHRLCETLRPKTCTGTSGIWYRFNGCSVDHLCLGLRTPRPLRFAVTAWFSQSKGVMDGLRVKGDADILTVNPRRLKTLENSGIPSAYSHSKWGSVSAQPVSGGMDRGRRGPKADIDDRPQCVYT